MEIAQAGVGRPGRAMLCGEKSHADRSRCPYCKPTQVDEERILRPSGEMLLRNSAKLPRNFGIRGASKEVAVNRPRRLFSKNTGLC